MSESSRRICIFTETFFPEVGGGETQAQLLAESLSHRGFRVLVLCRRSRSELAGFEQLGPISVHRQRPSGKGQLKKWGLVFTGPVALFRLRKQYDLILVSGFRVVGFTTVVVCKLLGKPCLLKADSRGEMSGDFFRGGLARIGLSVSSAFFRMFIRLRNYVLKRADGFVAISTDVSDEFLRCGVPAKKTTLIPNGVDVDRFRPATEEDKASLRNKLNIKSDGAIFVYTGRLVSYKGLSELLRAWRRLASDRADAILLIVGAGSLDIHNCEPELRDFVDSNGLGDRVLFTGSRTNVEDYLRASDVFVFPTRSEAFGISLVEAMACGLPAITTQVGGVRDIVQDGINGVTVDVDDEDQLKDAMERLLSNNTLARELGSSARMTVLEHFSVTNVTNRYQTLFDEVTASPRRFVNSGL